MKKNFLMYTLVVLGLVLSTCVSAHALANGKKPEIDPNLAISGLTLLGGTLALLRFRRKK